MSKIRKDVAQHREVVALAYDGLCSFEFGIAPLGARRALTLVSISFDETSG